MQSSPPAKAQAFLSIRCNSGPSQYYELTERITTIGRSRDNVLEIPDKNMSRRHSVIERRDDGVFIITDCNSSNGTVVNEERILSRELDHGDVIECGQTRIEFVYDDPAGAHTVVGKTKGAEESRADMQRKTAELGVVLGQREDLRKLLAINKELNKGLNEGLNKGLNEELNEGSTVQQSDFWLERRASTVRNMR